MKALLGPLGLGRTQTVVPANLVGCRPHSTSDWSIIAEKARSPRKAIERVCIAPHLGFEARTRLPEFLRRHVSRPPRWSVDDSGETSSIVEQTPLLMRLKADIGETGEMQHRPEAITAAREVVTGGRGRV